MVEKFSFDNSRNLTNTEFPLISEQKLLLQKKIFVDWAIWMVASSYSIVESECRRKIITNAIFWYLLTISIPTQNTTLVLTWISLVLRKTSLYWDILRVKCLLVMARWLEKSFWVSRKSFRSTLVRGILSWRTKSLIFLLFFAAYVICKKKYSFSTVYKGVKLLFFSVQNCQLFLFKNKWQQ